MFKNRLTMVCTTFLCLTFCLPGVLSSQTKQTYNITWSTLNEGGKTEEATSASYRLKDAIGQPVIGKCESASYKAYIGFWALTQLWEEVGIAEEFTNPDAHPLVNSLSQNYPNPFTRSTVINYSIAKGTDSKRLPAVSLRIFDLSGRLVKTFDLTDDELPSKQVVWDGRNGEGQKVAPGVYFYKIETMDYENTKKLILLR